MNKLLVKHPLISEKATMISGFRKYSFIVEKNAVASEIKKIIETHYKVTIEKINIINVKSKLRRLGKIVGTKPGYKKAIVTLKKGQKLDVLPH